MYSWSGLHEFFYIFRGKLILAGKVNLRLPAPGVESTDILINASYLREIKCVCGLSLCTGQDKKGKAYE